jgi:glycolate oxidase
MHQSSLVRELRAALGGENVLSAPSELAAYDCDAFTLQSNSPHAVVFPRSTEQVAAAVQICNRRRAAVVSRGAGTGLAGGCLPTGISVVLMLTRMNQILEVSLRDRWVAAESGVSNTQLTRALAGTGYCFAAEPSIQGASTIGGNVATNSSGLNTFKHGRAVNHILGLEAVLGDGSIIRLGPIDDPAGLDLTGLATGSEGTLAVVTKVWLRLTSVAQDYRTVLAIFSRLDDAHAAVRQILGAGIIPSAMELMDQGLMSAIGATGDCDFPQDAQAAILIEIDGPAPLIDRRAEQIGALCQKHNAQKIDRAATSENRERLWKCRKAAIKAAGECRRVTSADGHASCDSAYLIEDCIVPVSRLPQMLQRIAEIGIKHQVRILSLAHAAEGNIHPFILFDRRDPAGARHASAASGELLSECLALGGSVAGEHGIGSRKTAFMPRQYRPGDLEAMQRVRYSFDPYELFNPGKLLFYGNEIQHGVTEGTEK